MCRVCFVGAFIWTDEFLKLQQRLSELAPDPSDFSHLGPFSGNSAEESLLATQSDDLAPYEPENGSTERYFTDREGILADGA